MGALIISVYIKILSHDIACFVGEYFVYGGRCCPAAEKYADCHKGNLKGNRNRRRTYQQEEWPDNEIVHHINSESAFRHIGEEADDTLVLNPDFLQQQEYG